MKKLSYLLSIGFISLLACCADKGDGDVVQPIKIERNVEHKTMSMRATVPRNASVDLPANFTHPAASHSSGDRTKNLIAMTFDDGPHPQHTPRLLDMLRRRNIKATFYVIGQKVERYPHIVRRIVAEGHEIGNHTWKHDNLKRLSDSQVLSDLRRTDRAIAKACGVKPRTLRPPYGSFYQRQRQMVYNNMKMPTILWDVDPEDWKKPGVSVVSSRLVNRAKNGSILLAHDLHGSSVDAMPSALDGLLRKGYKFVTVSQLLAQKSQ